MSDRIRIYGLLESGLIGGYVTDYSQIKNAPDPKVNTINKLTELILQNPNDPNIPYTVAKVYDSLNNNIFIESHAKATYMKDGSAVDDAINDIKLIIELERQFINLSKDNINKISFYVNTSLGEVLKELGNKGIWIGTSPINSLELELSITSVYNTETGLWEGNMANLDFRLGYAIEVSEDMSIVLTGKPLNPKDYAIPYGETLMIGYPYNKRIEINAALANIPNPQEGDRIVSSEGRTYHSVYTSGMWTGDM